MSDRGLIYLPCRKTSSRFNVRLLFCVRNYNPYIKRLLSVAKIFKKHNSKIRDIVLLLH